MKYRAIYFYIILLIPAFLSSCVTTEYNPATEREDIMLVSTEKEIEIGRNIAEGIKRNPEIVLDPDPLMTERVIKIGERVAEVSERKEVRYTFHVIDKDEVNAFALPGGYIFIFKGLMNKIESDDELAAVIAHEIGHIVARHSIKRLQGELGYTILQIFIASTGRSSRDIRDINTAFGHLIMSYSREDEALADRIAVRYLKKAGFNPEAMITFLKKLQQVNKEAPIRPYSYYRSHPYIADRIRMIKQYLSGEVEFRDYMNKSIME